MELTEEMILKSLILGDITDLRNFCDSFVSSYVENKVVGGSISRKKYLDFLTDFHSTFLDFMKRYKVK